MCDYLTFLFAWILFHESKWRKFRSTYSKNWFHVIFLSAEVAFPNLQSFSRIFACKMVYLTYFLHVQTADVISELVLSKLSTV